MKGMKREGKGKRKAREGKGKERGNKGKEKEVEVERAREYTNIHTPPTHTQPTYLKDDIKKREPREDLIKRRPKEKRRQDILGLFNRRLFIEEKLGIYIIYVLLKTNRIHLSDLIS
ncbi:unnamed protein product [Rhizophagus irregularis]|nr:unnamed protein product [Rhizophagus irregularis]